MVDLHLLAPLQQGNGIFGPAFFCVSAVFGLLLYFLPSMIAVLRNHSNMVLVIALNIILGWTGIGWIATLIFSLVGAKGEEGRSIFFS